MRVIILSVDSQDNRGTAMSLSYYVKNILMKKLNLILLLPFIGLLPSQAQTPLNPKKVMAHYAMAHKSIADASQKTSMYTSTTILRDADLPDGTMLERYGIAGFYYINPLTGLSLDSYFGKVKKIYEATNGDVYIYEPVYYLSSNSWIKAKKSNGDTLVVKLPQVVDSVHYAAGELGFNTPDSTVYYYVDHLALTTIDAQKTYAPVADHEMKFTYKDGSLTQVTNADGSCDLLGVVDPNGTWVGCGDLYIKRKQQTDTIVTLPKDAEPVDYKMTSCKDDDYSEETTITLYKRGNDVYYEPKSEYGTGWVKGTIKDDKLQFGVQYLGIDRQHQNYLYFMPATMTESVDDDWGITTYNYALKSDRTLSFDIRDDGNTFITDSGYVVNNGKEKYDCEYEAPRASKIIWEKVIETPVTPGDPEIIYAPTWDDAKGLGKFDIYSSASGVDGEEMNPNKLFYDVYINDEKTPYTFKHDMYPNDFDEDVTDIPFTHSSPNFFASGNTREITFYVKNWTKIGVQMVYRGAGEEHRSNIVWAENPETTGIRLTGHDSKKQNEERFDLSGRRIQRAQRGVTIKHVGAKVYKVVNN